MKFTQNQGHRKQMQRRLSESRIELVYTIQSRGINQTKVINPVSFIRDTSKNIFRIQGRCNCGQSFDGLASTYSPKNSPYLPIKFTLKPCSWAIELFSLMQKIIVVHLLLSLHTKHVRHVMVNSADSLEI